MGWSRTATVGPWRPPCPGSEVAGRQAATPAASRPLRIGPAVGLLGGRRSYLDGLRALLTLGDVELDRLALVQRAIVLDGAGVHEHIGAGLGLEEAVALVGVEPLDGSNSHTACPPPLARRFSATPASGDASGKGQARLSSKPNVTCAGSSVTRCPAPRRPDSDANIRVLDTCHLMVAVRCHTTVVGVTTQPSGAPTAQFGRLCRRARSPCHC